MRRTQLKKASKAYSKALSLYHRSTKPIWLENHPACMYQGEGDVWCGETFRCTVHHMMGRKKYLNDMSTYMTLCPRHHAWVEDNKRKARELGYILYK